MSCSWGLVLGAARASPEQTQEQPRATEQAEEPEEPGRAQESPGEPKSSQRDTQMILSLKISFSLFRCVSWPLGHRVQHLGEPPFNNRDKLCIYPGILEPKASTSFSDYFLFFGELQGPKTGTQKASISTNITSIPTVRQFRFSGKHWCDL